MKREEHFIYILEKKLKPILLHYVETVLNIVIFNILQLKKGDTKGQIRKLTHVFREYNTNQDSLEIYIFPHPFFLNS